MAHCDREMARNSFYLNEDGGNANGNFISLFLSFEKSKFSGRGDATMVCTDENFHLFFCLKTPRFIPI